MGVWRRSGKMVVGMTLKCGVGTSMEARIDCWLCMSKLTM